MTRTELLTRADHIVNGRRNEEYGGPESSFCRIAELWNAYLMEPNFLSPEDVAVMMMLVKIARIAESNYMSADSWVDIAGYAACGAELSGCVMPEDAVETRDRAGEAPEEDEGEEDTAEEEEGQETAEKGVRLEMSKDEREILDMYRSGMVISNIAKTMRKDTSTIDRKLLRIMEAMTAEERDAIDIEHDEHLADGKYQKSRVDKGKIKALRGAGWKMSAIASDLGISVATVSKVLKEAGNAVDG